MKIIEFNIVGINPAYVGKTKEWIHKEPNFEDFIKWINKK